MLSLFLKGNRLLKIGFCGFLFLCSSLAYANVPIQKGWNLVSLPIATETTTEAFFQQYTGQFNYIWHWDPNLNANQGAWRVYPQVDDFAMLEQLLPNTGYWINSERNTELIADSNVPNATFQVADLPSSWTMLGFSQLEDGDSVTPERYFGLEDNIMLWGWDADSYNWAVWSPKISIEQLTPVIGGEQFPVLTELQVGKGYWINNQATTVCIPTETYFEENISPILQANCTACHTATGAAQSTRFVLKTDTDFDYLTDNFTTFKNVAAIQANGTSILLQKPIGVGGHGGGVRFSDTSDEFQKFTEMADRFDNPVECDTCLPDEDFFAEKIWYPVLSQACVVCHNPHGPAYLTRLVLDPANVSANFDILKEVAGFEVDGTSIFLLKPTSQVVHTGGELISTDSADYQNMAEMVNRFKNPVTCDLSEAPPSVLEKVIYETPQGLLRKAAYSLAGRLPSAEEEATVESQGIDALDGIMDQMMTEPLFYERLKEIYNDMLLTNKYDRWESAINLLRDNNYPNRQWYREWIERDAEDRRVLEIGKSRNLVNRDDVIGGSDTFLFTPPNEGVYTFILDASQSTERPVLNVQAGTMEAVEQEGNPFERPVYLRGSFNSWISPPPEETAFIHTGNGQLVLTISLTGNQHHLKVSDEHWHFDLGVLPGGYDFLRDYTNHAVAQAPLELIAHVVRENRPFSEILTADYMMVNPFSARVYGIEDLAFTDEQDPTLVNPSQFQAAQIPGMSHAGLLTSPMFLNRYSTTATNRNRHRASKVFEYFLHTNINGLSSRPIDASKIETHNPTTYNPTCTGCHALIDPVAGTFKNWRWDGAYELETFWYQDMRPPGYSDNIRLPASYSTNSLQWLAQQIAKDPRFRISTLHTVYEGFTGQTPVKSPSDINDPAYAQKVEAFNIQEETFQTIDQRFQDNNYNLKELIKGIVMSPTFRASSASEVDETNEVALGEIGMSGLLTPEQLDRKISAVLGYDWSDALLNEHEYRILYGGIDSDTIIDRVTDLNGLMVRIQERMANEMSCRSVAYDFAQYDTSLRKLFPYVGYSTYTVTQGSLNRIHYLPQSILDKAQTLLNQSFTTEGTYWKAIQDALGDDYEEYRWNVFSAAELEGFVPEDESGTPNPDVIAAIKQNIQYLHQRILREELPIDDPEIERTYTLFYETWQEGTEAMRLELVRLTEATIAQIDEWNENVPDSIIAQLPALITETYMTRDEFEVMLRANLGDADTDQWGSTLFYGADRKVEDWLHWRCNARRDLNIDVELPVEYQLGQDPHYLLRSWRAVLTYLLLDYRFLYE